MKSVAVNSRWIPEIPRNVGSCNMNSMGNQTIFSWSTSRWFISWLFSWPFQFDKVKWFFDYDMSDRSKVCRFIHLGKIALVRLPASYLFFHLFSVQIRIRKIFLWNCVLYTAKNVSNSLKSMFDLDFLLDN